MKRRWNMIAMSVLVLLTVAVPLIGIVVGFTNITNRNRRKQAYILLGFGIILIGMWIWQAIGGKLMH